MPGAERGASSQGIEMRLIRDRGLRLLGVDADRRCDVGQALRLQLGL